MLTVIASEAVPGDSGLQLMARVLGWDGALLNPGEVATVFVQATDLTAEGQVPGSSVIPVHNPDVLNTVLALVQDDPAWTMDSADAPGPDGTWGYNVFFLLPAADSAGSGDSFQVDLQIVPTAGEPLTIVFQVPTWKVYG